jgi:hypothetical protein
MSLVYIFMPNSKDAMMALDMFTQDRLWQMMRRIAPGRLSEILVQ